MGIKKCFGIPDDLAAPIWHIKLGKCAIVIGRVYALLIAWSLVIVSGAYVYTRPYSVQGDFFRRPFQESRWINNTWPEFIDCCSGEKVIEN